MEPLTAAKKKELLTLGKLDGLRRARAAIAKVGMPKSCLMDATAIIDLEILKIMGLPENDF